MALWGKRERVQCNAEQVFSCMHMQLVKFLMSPANAADQLAADGKELLVTTSFRVVERPLECFFKKGVSESQG